MDQPMEPVQIALEMVDGLVQALANEVVNSHKTPAGEHQTAQAFQVIGRPGHRTAADHAQGLADAFEAVAHRTREDRIKQQKRCHRPRGDALLLGLAEHLVGAGRA